MPMELGLVFRPKLETLVFQLQRSCDSIEENEDSPLCLDELKCE